MPKPFSDEMVHVYNVRQIFKTVCVEYFKLHPTLRDEQRKFIEAVVPLNPEQEAALIKMAAKPGAQNG